MMGQEQITFAHLAWAAFLFRVPDKDKADEAYLCLYQDSILRRRLVYAPHQVNPNEIEEKLIGFLSAWGMRMPGKEKPSVAKELHKRICDIAPDLQSLDGCLLETVNLTNHQDTIERVYSRLQKVRRLGPTGISKVLGILNPLLFVMWDSKIRKEYETGDKPTGYGQFMSCMHGMAQRIVKDANQLGFTNPAEFISRNLGISPPFTVAKFIDEHNYLRFTRNAKIPPSWHPDKEQGIHAPF